MAVNGSNTVSAVVLVIFGNGLCGTWPIRRRLALHQRGDRGNRNHKGKMVRGGGHRIAGEIALQLARDLIQQKQKRTSIVRSPLRVSSKQSPGNFAPQ